MCRPLSHDFSPPGGGAACGKSRVTELVTVRLSAGWLKMSPARLVTTDNATISAAAAMVLNIFPVPPNALRNQRSDPMISSFDSEVFARRPLTDSPLISGAGLPRESSPQLARTLLLIVPLIKAGFLFWWMRCSLRPPPLWSWASQLFGPSGSLAHEES